ncbi:ATP-NAD/AcoX kinase [Candidatus Vecturithrix granuli]|uniref:ATP-NAD/AcoX kinase n=1 Tax=Vecturithrix granuli TaxID=1499967 RepID=A0A081C7F2_VECG1|nr:ATP-NAD/AcoX kinase [Candidatus Vecturithrix granuli]
MKKVGIIVNPVAGMGGRVGLKGSDGVEILRMARKLGAEPESPKRTVDALKSLATFKDQLEFITYPHEMGEDECRAAGLSPRVIGSIQSGETTAEDTEKAAQLMLAENVDLLLFAGGDGTARNICHAVKQKMLTLGIPTGVKIHSAVYATTPGNAGEVALMTLEGRIKDDHLAEVMDIDEAAFRNGIVSAKLYGFLRVPTESRFVQNAKSGGIASEKEVLQGIAMSVIEAMTAKDVYFIIGPGTTTRTIMENLRLENTLLGVDVLYNKQLVAQDVNEAQLLEIIKGKKARIVVTVIGRQGYLFGRGNQQISPRVIREVGKEHIIVIATKEKLIALQGRPLLVDTGDEELDKELQGYVKVTTGYADYTMYKVGY